MQFLCIRLVPWVELWGINFCSFPIGMKAADSFMFHYPRNVYCGIREQSHITGWHSPFNHPPPAPHPCNHVSSYIIAFQLLTGVWPLPPNMPNLIHVFPQRQRDALFWKTEEKKKGACINMLCHAEAIKRDAAVFFSFSLGSQHLFIAGRMWR